MKKLYLPVLVLYCTCTLFHIQTNAQNCSLLQAICQPYESRCAATGSIKITAGGGSGNYKYRTFGPVNTNFTTTDSITGLAAGTYSVVVNDIVTNCSITIDQVVIPGSYQDPRFILTKTDVSCDNGSNGIIVVEGQEFGREPFAYSIIAPSPMGVGTTNSSGIFTGLSAGEYSIRMTDSCGGIQTRRIFVNNYTWRIDAYPFTKTACDQATGHIRVSDSHGNISTVSGIPGFQYGIVRSPGDTIWSSDPHLVFSLNGNNNFQVLAKDSCGTIKTGNTSVFLEPYVNATVQTSGFRCNEFSATITGIINFFDPEFCLYDDGNNLIACNTTGAFSNLPYGSYCIIAHDACTDTSINRCFQATAPPISVAAQVSISNKTCETFTVTITGQTGLTNPRYCIDDSIGNTIECNTTGIFNDLPYGNYCINIIDNCRDTTITRCFSATKPTPVLNPLIPAYTYCDVFGLTVSADSVFQPIYCLLDSNGVTIECNETGIFNNIHYGDYCVTMNDRCYDTTLTQCISISGPIIINDLDYTLDYVRCNAFGITATTHYQVTEYCLYDGAGNLIICNSDGVFTDLPAGEYCIRAPLVCPDTTLQKCFILRGPAPSVGNSVSTTNATCRDFTASITRQDNLVNPTFCLYDLNDNLVACNNRGIFNNLDFGSYCIRITTECYDTTIVRCFSRWPNPVNISANANKSCSFGYASFSINMNGAILPAHIRILNPDGSLFLEAYYNRNSFTIDSIPGLTTGERYTIIATDQCGNSDTAQTGAVASYFTHNPSVTPRCPGGTWVTGSGNIVTAVSTNLGSVSVRIIKKNGVNYSPALSPSSTAGNTSHFNDLGPGTYIVRYTENSCNKVEYDTVTIVHYQYPNLNRSTGYQCDVNGFSVSAIATNGVGPYMYEIIGSVPTTPSIITSPQSSTIFNINNGSNYSLIRLRAVDACGNATLGDASILPLANNGILVTNNCFESPTTLSVDSIYNASYAWYVKENTTATDSTFLGNSSSIHIPLLSAADTGIYVCHLIVNAGCIKRTYQFNLTGMCHVVLPISSYELRGQESGNRNMLTWKPIDPGNIQSFIIEKKTSNDFMNIGRVDANGLEQYSFNDYQVIAGRSYYRIKVMYANRSFRYSNTIMLQNKAVTDGISVFPNPAVEQFTIRFNKTKEQTYAIRLYGLSNQLMLQSYYASENKGQVTIQRPAGLANGLYILHVTNLETQETETRQIIFK